MARKSSAWPWTSTLRRFRKAGKLSKERLARLENVGFVWEPLDATWEQRFFDLCEFKRTVGHCNVPAKWQENQQLGTWVSILRGKRATVSPERVRRLEELGFVWDAIKAAWEEQFAKLVRYKAQYGHCNVPARWPEDSSLATWVRSRRRDKQEGVLSKEHTQRLDDIGFVWDRFSASWEEMFTTLVEFKNQHGHCRVPRHCADNPEMGQWVTNQRSKRDRLTEDRIRRLNEIGFQWKVKKGPKPGRTKSQP